MDKRIVHTKGKHDEQSFEIAILRQNNAHGKISYGWFDKNKLLVSSSGGPCRVAVNKPIWDGLVALAERIAAKMNTDEKSAPTMRPIDLTDPEFLFDIIGTLENRISELERLCSAARLRMNVPLGGFQIGP